MARWWNQLQSTVYSRLRWLPELYARALAGDDEELPLPPLASLRRPLAEATVGIITAGGVHLSAQQPFNMEDPDGDASVRIIPSHADLSDLRITHDYYDHSAADRDVNTVFPLERLRELARAGEIGGVAARQVSMMGHLLGAQRRRLVERSAGDIADVFKEDATDLVLATPG
jgi:D-proline reductase (dithiol) PrdB